MKKTKSSTGINKKNDDRKIDEEANHFIESELTRNNEEKVNILVDQVTQMRNLSRHLGG